VRTTWRYEKWKKNMKQETTKALTIFRIFIARMNRAGSGYSIESPIYQALVELQQIAREYSPDSDEYLAASQIYSEIVGMYKWQ